MAKKKPQKPKYDPAHLKDMTLRVKKIAYCKSSFYILVTEIVRSAKEAAVGTELTCKGSIFVQFAVGDQLEIKGLPVREYDKWKKKEVWNLKIIEAALSPMSANRQAIRMISQAKGVGEKKAQELISRLASKGKDPIAIIVKQPSVLRSMNFLSPEQQLEIYKKVKEIAQGSKLQMALMSLEITDRQIAKMTEYFSGVGINAVKKRVFELTEVDGFGFWTVSKIADSFGIPTNDPGRVDACIIYTMRQMTSDGHCFTEGPELVDQVKKTLKKVTKDLIIERSKQLVKHHHIVTDKYNMAEDSEILPGERPFEMRNESQGTDNE